MYAGPRRALSAGAAALLAWTLAAPSAAQQETAAPAGPAAANGRSMTLEELEDYIAEQKAALEKVERNREITLDKAKKVEEELARRKAREAELEDEMRALCEDRTAVVAEAEEALDEGDCDVDPAG